MDERKRMRLGDYDYSQSGCYFITTCTSNRCNILGDIVGDGSPVPSIRLSECGMIADSCIHTINEKYPGATIAKHVVMPNHVHMLVLLERGTENPSPTIGTIMAWHKYQTTKKVNALRKQMMKMWQRSYYDHIVRTEQDFFDIWNYIDHNPARWQEDQYFNL